MPTLLARSFGPDIPLDRRAILIGRHPECDVLLDSLRVSRRHCIITTGWGDVVVRDLGSTNGTWVNGRRVTRGLLRPGDEIAIAHLRYRLGEAPTPRAAAAAGERSRSPEDEPDAANSLDL
jgi:pSer/pThr/pTyr-binding forkhead associated (FHA) protein